MSKPNDHQGGGSHYAAAVQHWDIVVMHDLNYFEGQITKYVMRARKKNGLQDLQKAKHFIEKYIAEWENISQKLPAAQIITVPVLRTDADEDQEYKDQLNAATRFHLDGFTSDGKTGYQCVICRKVTHALTPLQARRTHVCPLPPM